MVYGVSFRNKKQLVAITDKTNFKEDDLAIIRNMIEACNQYLDAVSKMNLPSIIYKSRETEGMWSDLNFDNAMNQFRKSFKKEIGAIEKRYDLSFNKAIPDEF